MTVLDKATRNFLALLRDGKERFRAIPHDGTYSWPLWVGKRWEHRYTWEDRDRGRSWSPIGVGWKVEAYEEVTVPAGTFKAFRLQSSPGMNNASFYTIWYDPQTKLQVKRIYERTSAHFLGAGRSVTELGEFAPPRR